MLSASGVGLLALAGGVINWCDCCVPGFVGSLDICLFSTPMYVCFSNVFLGGTHA